MQWQRGKILDRLLEKKNDREYKAVSLRIDYS